MVIFTLRHLCEGCSIENCCFTDLSCWGRRTGICGNLLGFTENKIPPKFCISCQKPFGHSLGLTTPGNPLELVLLQPFPFPGGFGALGWVFNREILFPCFPADPVTVPPNCGNRKYSRIFHRVAPPELREPLWAMPFLPKFAFWGDAVVSFVGKRGICWGISGYKQEQIWELPLGILIAEFGCCIHIYILFILEIS